MGTLEKKEIEQLKVLAKNSIANMANIRTQIELLNNNLERLDSTLGAFYEELFSGDGWKKNLFDIEQG